jgi:hypothetical protein
MFIFDRSVRMTPQKATMDSMRTLTVFVSYRLLSPQFQFSLSAAALGIYLYDQIPLAPGRQFSFAIFKGTLL